MIHAFHFALVSKQMICRDLNLFQIESQKKSNQILKSDLSNRIFIVQIESLNVLNRDLNPNRLLNLVTSEARMLREENFWHRDNYGTSYGPVSAWLCWVSMNGMGVTGYKDGKEGKGNNWE